MYNLRPLQNHSDITINSPMYNMKNLQKSELPSSSPLSKDHSTLCNGEQEHSVSKVATLTNLCSVQDEILMQLKALKGQLSSLRLELGKKASGFEKCNQVSESIFNNAPCKTTRNDDHREKGVKSFEERQFQDQVPVSAYNVVINASPEYPPYSLLAVEKWWNGMIGTKIVSYVHSSVKGLPDHLNLFTKSKDSSDRSTPKILVNITLIWKKVDVDCELIISPLKQTAIRGEVNFLKFFNRIVNDALGITGDLLQETVLDSILDSCHQLSHSKNTKERSQLLNILSSYINNNKNHSSSGKNFTLVDLALWSIISRNKKQSLPSNLKDWYERISQFLGVQI